MIRKTADADHPVHELIAERWSPRAFADRDVSTGELRSMFEAARWAPSSFNEQPWRYLVARRSDDPEGWRRLFDCLSEKNQQWAQSAPVLFLSVARTTFTRNDRDNRVAHRDTGAASQNLAIQATALGLWVHQMAGFDLDKAREDLGIPEPFEPVAMGAVGHQGELDRIPEDFHASEKAERTRRPLAETVFAPRWGETSPLVGDS